MIWGRNTGNRFDFLISRKNKMKMFRAKQLLNNPKLSNSLQRKEAT